MGQGRGILPAGGGEGRGAIGPPRGRGYFEQALAALQHLPESRDTREQAIDLRLALRGALRSLNDFGRMLAYLHEAELLATALVDSRRLGLVSGFLSQHFRMLGAYDQAAAAAQRALALAAASGDSSLQALANLYLGRACKEQGDYRRAIACMQQIVTSLDEARRYERLGHILMPAVNARANLAACHAELGMFTEGRVLGEEGLRLAEAAAHPASLLCAYWGVGLLALRQGGLPRVLPSLERAMGMCQDEDLSAWFPRIASLVGAAYALAGRVADAVPLLTQAMEQTIAEGAAEHQVFYTLSFGEAQVLAGRLEEAHALADRALAHAREHQERGGQAYALRLLGDIAARREPPESDAGRNPLPPGPRPGRRTWHAPAPGPLPPRPGHAVCHDRPAGAGPCGTDDGYRRCTENGR